MASVESQVQEKVDTAVLVKSAELFGRSMASFLETEMDYIGYLREKPSRKVVVVDSENSTALVVDDGAGGGPAAGGDGGGGLPGFRLPRRRRNRNRNRNRNKPRSNRRAPRTQGRGGTPQRGARIRRFFGGGPQISQGRGGARGFRMPFSGPRVTTGVGGKGLNIGQRLMGMTRNIPGRGMASALSRSPVGRAVGRFLPGANVALGGAITASRLAEGNYLGAALSAGSMIPGPIGWAFLGAELLGMTVGPIMSKIGKAKFDNLMAQDDASRTALENAPSTSGLSAGDREALVQGSRIQDVGGSGSMNMLGNQYSDPLSLRPTPRFSRGRTIGVPTRALIGEAGLEVLFPIHKIGEAINAVYREGGSAMVGATLAFLHASPMSPTNSVLLSEAGRLKQQFGVSGNFAEIKGIGNYEVKPIPSLEESINNQSSSGQTTNGSQSVLQRFQSFAGGIFNSVLGIGSANAAPFNGAFIRGDLANTQVQNEITAKGLYLKAGEERGGAKGHSQVGITRVFGTKDGLGSGATAGGHGGIDIGTSHQRGYYVSFGMSGKVSFAGPMGGYGNLVIIESGGHDYFFGHLASISSGMTVGQPYTGQTIGEIGNTGGSTGEHLHFEKRTAGGGPATRMDPAAELGALSIGKRTKPTAPANKPVRPADPSKANKTVTTAPVTQADKNGQATSTQVPVPIPIPQPVKEFVAFPVEVLQNAGGFIVDVFGKGGKK